MVDCDCRCVHWCSCTCTCPVFSVWCMCWWTSVRVCSKQPSHCLQQVSRGVRPVPPPPPSGYGMARQCMCRGCGRWLTSQLLLLSSLNGCTSMTETQLSCFMSLRSRQNSGSSHCVPVRLHKAPSDCCSGGYSDCRNPSVPPPRFLPRNTFGSEARCAGLHVCIAIVLCSCCHTHRASGLVLQQYCSSTLVSVARLTFVKAVLLFSGGWRTYAEGLRETCEGRGK